MLVGGSILMFVVKAGSVGVLVDADRAGPAVERPPLRVDTVRQAERFSLERFSDASTRFRHRFVRLGLGLLIVYGMTVGVYLLALVSLYRVSTAWNLAWLGTLGAAAASTLLVVAITIINLIYLLLQVLVVSRDTSVARAIIGLPGFIRGQRSTVLRVFAVVLLLVLIATAASILATAALGFIGFVPIVGLAMLPLQLLAWIGRGLLFEFLGLAALTTYAGLVRRASRRKPAALGTVPGRCHDLRRFLSRGAAAMRESAIRKMGAVGARVPDLISFAAGYPDPATFPWDAFREITNELLDGHDPNALQYGATRGYRPLVDDIGQVLESHGHHARRSKSGSSPPVRSRASISSDACSSIPAT